MNATNLALNDVDLREQVAADVQAFSFAFWVKAGIGFSLGAMLVSMVGFFLWITILLPLYADAYFRLAVGR